MAKRYYRAEGPVRTKNDAALVRENPSEPCGLPFGSRSVVLESAAKMGDMNSVKTYDLYEGVNKGMKEDAKNLRSLVKPHNW